MSRTKIMYLEYKFNNVTRDADVEVRLDSQVIPKKGVTTRSIVLRISVMFGGLRSQEASYYVL